MEEISITWKTILLFFSGMTVVGVGISWILKLFTPFGKLKSKVDNQELLLKNDNKRLNLLEESTKVQNKVLLALVDHEITGNSIDKLRDAKNDLQNYLINR